jgi:hypothetical protein
MSGNHNVRRFVLQYTSDSTTSYVLQCFVYPLYANAQIRESDNGSYFLTLSLIGFNNEIYLAG